MKECKICKVTKENGKKRVPGVRREGERKGEEGGERREERGGKKRGGRLGWHPREKGRRGEGLEKKAARVFMQKAKLHTIAAAQST